jgi:hypothetical protein
MRHDEERDNTTAIENQIREADAHADTREDVDKIVPVIVTVDELPPIPRVPFNPPVQIVEQRHPEHNDGANGYDDDPEDPEHDPIGDADTDYDIEYDDEPEDDGQPSEYEEWQDYMGGDEYYDHSENEIW